MSTHHPAEGRRVAGVVVGLTAALTVLLTAFAWPASQLEPRGVPLALVAPPGAGDQVAAALAGAMSPDAFEVTPLGSRDAAVAAIADREAYGAIVMSASGTEMLVASAAGPAVAQMLTKMAEGMSAASGTAPVVTDVVPLPSADPRGVVFGAGAFPLVVGGIAVGLVLALRVPGRRQQLVAGVGVAVASGLALAAVQQLWLDALGGSYWANAGVYALAIGAMAAVVAGMHHVLGLPGLGLAAATILLLGNPLSAITSAPELLPDGWSTLGQLLPPGAAGSALRSTAYFDGAAAAAPLLVLGAWLVAGVVLAALPLRQAAARRTASRPDRMVETHQPA
jgi:hypothetical protein